MKNLTFSGYPETVRTDIVTFSSFYKKMIQEIISKLTGSSKLNLCLGRVHDTGFLVKGPILFFEIIRDANILKTKYYADYYDAEGEKIAIEKEIRLDNPLGEIPILPGYKQLPELLLIGETLTAYSQFIAEVREMLVSEIGNTIQLRYRNGDGTFSVIEGKLIEVNKGNIFMEDYREFYVVENVTIKCTDLFNRKKNHRFISEKGYLFAINHSMLSNANRSDDGKVFGEKKVWDFLTSKKEEIA